MKRRSSLNRYSRNAVALLAVLSGGQIALGQEESQTDVWEAGRPNLSLAVTQVAPTLEVEQVVPTDPALTSTEQGRTDLDQSFGDFRAWQLKERREALADTKVEFNLRTFYFDRSDFSGAEKQAWAFGGWVGVKTGYFLDHFAFGATLYTTNPIYAPDDRDGTSLLEEGQNGFTVLGELYADIRIMKGLGITIGAKGYDTPFISRNDNRMLPNPFEAVVLQGRYEFSQDTTDNSPGVNPDG